MSEIRLLKLDRRNDRFIARLFPQSACAVLQDGRPIRFREEEEERPCDRCKDYADPESPAPGDDTDEA